MLPRGWDSTSSGIVGGKSNVDQALPATNPGLQFGSKDAEVACRQLGFEAAWAEFRTVGGGSGPILADDLGCDGSEATLQACRQLTGTAPDCTHSEDVGVACVASLGPGQKTIRFSAGGAISDGPRRIEIFKDGEWGTVCDDIFGRSDALVACRQLGYETTDINYGTVGGGSGPILADELDCVGSEATLQACRQLTGSAPDCGHSEDVGVRCGSSGPARTAGDDDEAVPATTR